MSAWVRVLGWATAAAGVLYFVRRFVMPQGPPFPDCSREFTADRHGGARDMSSVRLVVLHSAESPSARSTAEYFASTSTPASTQLVVGQDGCYRTLDDDVVPYGAGSPANEKGLHVEQAGYAAWTREEWLARGQTLREAGGAVGGWCRQYGIPCRFLYAADLVRLSENGWPANMGGVTTHAEVSKAWHNSTHMDPGGGYPVDVVMGYAGGEWSPEGGVA